MKILLYFFCAFMMFTALGVALFASGSEKWLLALGNGSVGIYFYFQARSWTPEKSLKLFGLHRTKK